MHCVAAFAGLQKAAIRHSRRRQHEARLTLNTDPTSIDIANVLTELVEMPCIEIDVRVCSVPVRIASTKPALQTQRLPIPDL